MKNERIFMLKDSQKAEIEDKDETKKPVKKEEETIKIAHMQNASFPDTIKEFEGDPAK